MVQLFAICPIKGNQDTKTYYFLNGYNSHNDDRQYHVLIRSLDLVSYQTILYAYQSLDCKCILLMGITTIYNDITILKRLL